ncbi:MAG TPA: amidohydrolase [Gemmatimonadales bacterium]|nr:amidohydrolase [Gemmatimonadales bacterium]
MRPGFAAFALLLPSSLPAQSDADVAKAVDRVAPRMIQVRHDIHQHPELSNRETRTAELVATELGRLGFEVRTGVAHTGVVGVLKSGRSGPVIAIRADMDALPVTEETDVPFKSMERAVYLGHETGVMHACGHDIHVAAELGVANVLAGMRDRLRGTVVFLFQPAEEGAPDGETGGAKLMIEEGALDHPRPDLIIGFHTNGSPPHADGDAEVLGHVTYTPGPAMASSAKWTARIIGRQAHGATPNLGVDAVVTASQVVLALQTIHSRNLSPFTPSVLTVGILQSGTRNNIVAGEAYLEGTVRTFDDSVYQVIQQRMRDVFDGVTKSAGATYQLEFSEPYPVTVNDSALSRRFVPVLRRVVGSDNVRLVPPHTGAEDFSYYARVIPGFFLFVGVVPAGRISGGHHTPTFYADDQSIPIAMRVMTALALDALGLGGH